MKKILFSIIITGLLLFLWPSLSSAQSTQSEAVGTTTSQAIDLAKVDYRYNAILEFFLQKALEKDFDNGYSLTAGSLQKHNSKEDFAGILQAAGLTDFISKKWTFFKDEMKDIGVTTVKGEFTTPNQEIHKVTFYVIIGGETELKVGEIIENINFTDLPKRFPAKEQLAGFAQQDLTLLTQSIAKNKSKKILAALSANGKNRTKLTEIQKAIRMMKAKRLDISLPADADIKIADGNPTLNDQGLMVVKGTYGNSKSKIDFTLAYDYEWKWRLGGFTLTAKALAKKKKAPPK